MEMNSGKAKRSFPMELITVEAFLFLLLLFLLNLIKDYLIKSYLIKSYLILSYLIKSYYIIILIKDQLDFRLQSLKVDSQGRYVLLEALIQDSPFALLNIYAPNKCAEQCDFFQQNFRGA